MWVPPARTSSSRQSPLSFSVKQSRPSPALSCRTAAPAVFRFDDDDFPAVDRITHFEVRLRRAAFRQPVAHQQIHRSACLPENIAEEITLFAADLVHHLPQRCRWPRFSPCSPPVSGNNRTPAASGQTPARQPQSLEFTSFSLLSGYGVPRRQNGSASAELMRAVRHCPPADRASAPDQRFRCRRRHRGNNV